MNPQENIRRILREEYTLPNLIRRRFNEEELDKLVSNVERTFETHRISQQHREDVIDAEVDDFIMNSVYYGEFEDFDDEIYQDIYNLYREPLVDYIKSKIDINLQESIRRILREELEPKWNTENKYDYQHGFCHYFAYNIIGRLKKLYPNKNIRYYLILADEVYDYDEGEVEQSYLIHAYIKIDDLYLDSNGFATEDEIEKRTQDWYDGQLEELPEDYRIDIWHDEYNKIPKYFLNNQFCNTGIIKKDIETFLSYPEVRELLKIID